VCLCVFCVCGVFVVVDYYFLSSRENKSSRESLGTKTTNQRNVNTFTILYAKSAILELNVSKGYVAFVPYDFHVIDGRHMYLFSTLRCVTRLNRPDQNTSQQLSLQFLY